jgi:hypothetical protein
MLKRKYVVEWVGHFSGVTLGILLRSQRKLLSVRLSLVLRVRARVLQSRSSAVFYSVDVGGDKERL